MDTLSVIDICGDSLQGTKSITRDSGYIESLNYPDVYSPDTMCACNVTATQPDATIILKILDLNFSPGQHVSTSHDWLEYAAEFRQWGEGRKLNDIQRNEVVSTDLRTMYLNFHADGIREGRGFWLQYTGMESILETSWLQQASSSSSSGPENGNTFI